jgi:CRP/FNR family cyclic AMP-dependent transcriptional regulator
MLNHSAHLPEVDLAPGEFLVTEGNASGPLWVLVSGDLSVHKGGTEINAITRPGAVIGEISVLLGHTHGASVVATTPARLRVAQDGAGFLAGDSDIMRLVAVGLAERLNFVSTYLADLKDQYGDAPGLSMVADVLSTLSQHPGPTAHPGSARDPDPEY